MSCLNRSNTLKAAITKRNVHCKRVIHLKKKLNIVKTIFPVFQVAGSPAGAYQYDTCGKQYQHKKTLLAHVRAAHENKVNHTCTKCHKAFTYRHDVTRHEKTCTGDTVHDCPKCSKRCASAQGLRRHLMCHEKVLKSRNCESNKVPGRPTVRTAPSVAESRPSQVRCRRCTETFDNRRDLYAHGIREHYNQHGGALQPRPWEPNDTAPWDGDDALRQVYEANAPIILEHHRVSPLQSVYNFPLTNDVSMNQLMGYAEYVYRQQQRAFRLNLVFGVVLRNRESGHYRYFVPYTNNGVFERPLYISRRDDLRRLRRQLETKDILTELLRQRPDTKWIPVLVTNVRFLVTSTFYPLGQGQLPDYLMKKDSLYPLVKNRHNGKPYKDNLCAFRCLALHRGHKIKNIEGPAKRLYKEWTEEPVEDFEGLSIEEFPEFQTRFDVNLEVYDLTEDGFAWSVFKSRG